MPTKKDKTPICFREFTCKNCGKVSDIGSMGLWLDNRGVRYKNYGNRCPKCGEPVEAVTEEMLKEWSGD